MTTNNPTQSVERLEKWVASLESLFSDHRQTGNQKQTGLKTTAAASESNQRELSEDIKAIYSVLEVYDRLRRQEINELADLSDQPSECELTAILRTMQAYDLVKTTGYKWYVPQ